MKAIEINKLNSLLQNYCDDKAQTVARHALSEQDIYSVATSKDKVKEMDFNFSLNVKTLPVTNQKSSGRCWIFAATNVLREDIAKKCNISNFELSQSYIAFYDKLEKVNLALEILIELIDVDYDDRTLQFILQSGIGDGGQWDMFVNIVKKYGVCPKNVYPETYTSSNTRYINSLLNAEIRHFASDIRILKKSLGMEAVYKHKDNLISRVYSALVSCYGIPPEKFNFEYTSGDDKYHCETGYTPLSFFEKYVGDSLDNYVSVINAPTDSKPFYKSYTIKYLGNVVGGKIVKHINLPIKRLKDLCIAQLNGNKIVWFGSDVGSYRNNTVGSWDDTSYDFESLLGLDYKMDKGESLNFRASCMSHAMCITGVNLNNGVPTKWKIENSWGESGANKGYYMMSASFFDQYTYQAVIDKKYLTKEELDIYNAEPIELKPWDPMGSLAN